MISSKEEIDKLQPVWAGVLAAVEKMHISVWQPIETAPKDGSRVLCMRDGWEDPEFRRWRLNHRTDETYWGDPDEYDDYELADESNWPTHWLPIPPYRADRE